LLEDLLILLVHLYYISLDSCTSDRVNYFQTKKQGKCAWNHSFVRCKLKCRSELFSGFTLNPDSLGRFSFLVAFEGSILYFGETKQIPFRESTRGSFFEHWIRTWEKQKWFYDAIRRIIEHKRVWKCDLTNSAIRSKAR